MEFLTILPNLSIGVVSILSLVYVNKMYIKLQNDTHTVHMEELKEREQNIRDIEREVRTNVTEQLVKNSQLIVSAVQTMERVITFLDRK